MPEILETASSLTAATVAQIERSSAYLLQLLSFVPDERLEWTPSSTSRSALRIVGHCALVNRGFAEILAGRRPEVEPTPDVFFAELRAAERGFATRDAASDALQKTAGELIATIGALGDASIDTPRSSPFGAFPVSFWLEQTTAHLGGHVGQLAYLQTIWGDLDDHMG